MKRFAKRAITLLLLYGAIVVTIHYATVWTALDEPRQTETVSTTLGGTRDVLVNSETRDEANTETVTPTHDAADDVSVKSETREEDPYSEIKPFAYDKRFKNPCWYDTQGALKCLPYYFVVGVRKCGTTQLWYHLLKHPEMRDPGKKENNIFGYQQLKDETINDTQKIDRYVRFYEGASRDIAHLTDPSTGENKFVFGDGSTSNMYVNKRWKTYHGNEGLKEPKYVALDFVHSFLPATKIIICYRDPVERLYSEYYFTYGELHYQTNLNPQEFDAIARDTIEDFQHCLQYSTVRECVYNDFDVASKLTYRPRILLHLGIYYVYMEDLIRIYGREQILIIHMEDIEQTSTMVKAFEFLNLSRLPEDKLNEIVSNPKTINSRKSEYASEGPMLDSTRQLLNDFYKPFNERMASLVNDDYFLFTNDIDITPDKN